MMTSNQKVTDMSKTSPKGACRICNSKGPETFRYMQTAYLFDVDKARAICGDGREPVELDEEDVRHSLNDCRIHQQHVKHVDPSIPGIIAHIYFVTEEGEQLHGHRLIDGHHRAARCLQLGRPYRVYLLSEQESIDILLKSPCRPALETVG